AVAPAPVAGAGAAVATPAATARTPAAAAVAATVAAPAAERRGVGAAAEGHEEHHTVHRSHLQITKGPESHATDTLSAKRWETFSRKQRPWRKSCVLDPCEVVRRRRAQRAGPSGRGGRSCVHTCQMSGRSDSSSLFVRAVKLVIRLNSKPGEEVEQREIKPSGQSEAGVPRASRRKP